jgi:hypothetical protein
VERRATLRRLGDDLRLAHAQIKALRAELAAVLGMCQAPRFWHQRRGSQAREVRS